MVLSTGDFNHCSTLAPLGDGMLLAFYSGTGECRDDQSVSILFIKDKSIAYQRKLEGKTGNPVLWSVTEDKVVLLYSKFEDNKSITRIVDRWKFCSLWTVTITKTHYGFTQGKPKKLDIRPHLLGRCLPIIIQNNMLLPLYDEVNGVGVIYSVDGIDKQNFTHKGDLGFRMIQPTLWSSNDILFAMLRNFGNKKRFAGICASNDLGVTWSKTQETDIPNNNSSLHACRWNDQVYILWNNTLNRHRYNMTLGQLAVVEQVAVCAPVGKVAEYGAYPTMLVHNGNLHFSFTTQDHKIEYHEWNTKKLNIVRKATEAEYRRDLAE